MTESAPEAQIDRVLAVRARLHGDRRAFEQLVRRHQGMVRAQLCRLLRGDKAAADDLAQDTFVLAWRKLDQFRGEALFSTWLYRIAYTCFLQARRRPAQHADYGEETLQQLPASAQTIDLRLDLERAMQCLSENEQAALLHCVQMGLSHAEAAYVLAMPLGTVKTHVMRGKAKLKAWLSAWHHAEDTEDAP